MKFAVLAIVILGRVGHVTGATLSVPTDFPTIQSAISVAVSGDTIEVASGTYNETIELEGKDLTLVGLSGPQDTWIVGDLTSTVVAATLGENFELRGLTIAYGGSPPPGPGGGIHIVSGTGVIVDCIFRDNVAWEGGAIFADDSELYVSQTVFANNSSLRGGGIYSLGGSLNLTQCEFDSNTGWSFGGGLFSSGNAVVAECVFRNNGSESGAGINLCCGSPGPVILELSNTIFDSNIAGIGGAVSLDQAQRSCPGVVLR